jgi:hypothetical protein
MLAAAGWLSVLTVSAQVPPAQCEAAHIHVAGTLPASWLPRVAALCDALSRRSDLDPGADLEIKSASRDTLELRARLRDGRSAQRFVDSPDGLTLTAEALLVLPASPVLEPPPPPIAASAETTPAQQQPTAATTATESTVVLPPASPVHIAFQLSLIGHVAGFPAYVGGGFAAHAALRFKSVFIEISPRWEAQQASLPMRLSDFEMHSFGVAALFGVRIWDGVEGAGEIGAGALIVAEDQTYRPLNEEIGGTLIGGQVTTFARLLWGSSLVRWAVSADLTVSPGRLSHGVRIRDIFPPLPSIAFGFCFGVRWESR